MKIAIITSGILPVPAIQGGAVENLIDFYLDYNNIHHIHDLTIYSAYHPDVLSHHALSSKANRYEYINVNSLKFKIGMRLYALFPHETCYHHDLEYYFKLVYNRMKGHKYDMVILENRPGFAIKLRKLMPHVRIVSHIHTNTIHDHSTQNKQIIKATDLFITVSKYVKDTILNIGIPTKAEIVYNGLDTSTFNVSSQPIERSKLGFKETDFIIVFSGRLIPGKGIEELLLAMQKLTHQKDIKLLVLGAANFADKKNLSPFMEKLHNIADTMHDKVVFTGFIPYQQLPQYLKMANIMVVPSHINEAFGMTCIEGCAIGLPVIATDDGGIPETLTENKHILVDKDGDLPQLLANAILTIKNNYSDYQGNTLNPIFTKENYAKSFFDCLNELN